VRCLCNLSLRRLKAHFYHVSFCRGTENEQKIIVITKTYKRFAIAFKLEYKFMYVIRSVLDKYKALSYNLRVFGKKKGNKTIAKLITNEKLPGIRRKIVRSALSLFMV
jgi:hypothetical protein